MALSHPTININGTSPEQLYNDLETAREVLFTAMAAVKLTRPHPRDFMNNESFMKAVFEHANRHAAIENTHRELGELMEGLNR